MRFPIWLLGATLVLSVGCGLKKPRYLITATDVSNRVLAVRSPRSAEPVAPRRESIGAPRQPLDQTKTRVQAPVVPPKAPVTGTSGFPVTTPHATTTGTVGTTDGIPSHGATPAQAKTTTGVPPAGIAPRQTGSRPVWLAVMLVTALGALLLTRRRSVR